MESVFDRVKTFCLTQGTDYTYWIAYSGGLDSHVLLHACAELAKQHAITFKAIHVNHGLSPNAETWVAHCEAICKNLSIAFISENIHISSHHGESLEALARDLRYQAFAAHMGERDVLFTAHHQEDQAETVFLQLMRGAGPKGLSAMPHLKAFAKGSHGRPLLDVAKKTIEAYARNHHLSWVEDESNANVDFHRNFLRCSIFPELKKRWPAMADTLSRVARHCAETQDLVDVMMDEHLAWVKKGAGISIVKLLTLTPAIQRHVLRRWFSTLHFPIPSVVKMQQIQQSLLLAAEDKMPHITWGHVELRRYKDELYAMKKILMHDEKKNYEWDISQDLLLPNIGTLQVRKVMGKGLRSDITNVTVRFRHGGEFCRLPGRDFHHDLKKLFQQWGVPPWERSRIPLLFVDAKLIAVVGYYIDSEYETKKSDNGFVLSLS